MAGYIGNKSQTLVDGYTTTEADAEFVNDPNDVITVNGSNVGIGTSSPDAPLRINGDLLGSTTGTEDKLLTLHSPDVSNDTQYRFKNHRYADGTSHSSSELRIQRRVDATEQGYVGLRDAAVTFGYDTTENMRIDSAGRVTKSNQPMFEATDGSIAGNGDVYWTTIRANVGGHYNSSNGRFTAPVNGYYVFHATCGNSGTYGMDIMKNSGTYRRNEMVNPAGFRWTTVSTVMYLAAGDYVNCWIFTGSASTNQPYAGFSGYLLG